MLVTFVLGRYLFLEAHKIHCSHLGIDNFSWKTIRTYFSRQIEAIVSMHRVRRRYNHGKTNTDINASQ